MGSVKEITETITESIDVARYIAQKASAKAWSRVLLATFVGSVIAGAYLAYLTVVVNDYTKRSEEYLAEQELLNKELLDQKSVDYIQLCMDATASKDPNKSYYCEYAVTLYRDTFIDHPGSDVEKNIKLSAYGAMKVDTATRLRSTALERARLNAPYMSGDLKWMLKIGLWIVSIIGGMAMLGTAYVTYRISRDHANSPRIKSEIPPRAHV